MSPVFSTWGILALITVGLVILIGDYVREKINNRKRK